MVSASVVVVWVVVEMVVLCFVVCEVILVCFVLCWLVSVVLLVELCSLFVRLGVLSDCGEGVSCLLVGLCFGVCPWEVIVG